MLCFSMTENSVKKDSVMLGTIGISIGIACLLFIYGVEVFGPGTYSSGGTSHLNVGGVVTIETYRSSILPLLAQYSFFMIFSSLIFAIASGLRNERKIARWGAIGVGASPIVLYTLGFIAAIFWSIVWGYPCLRAHCLNMIKKHNKRLWCQPD